LSLGEEDKVLVVSGMYTGIAYSIYELLDYDQTDLVDQQSQIILAGYLQANMNILGEQELVYWVSMLDAFYKQKGNQSKLLSEAFAIIIYQYLATK